MNPRIAYTYTCQQCDAEGTTDDPHGMPGWLQLGISGSLEPSPFFCSRRCLIVAVVDGLV